LLLSLTAAISATPDTSAPSDQQQQQQQTSTSTPDTVNYIDNYHAIDLIRRYRQDSLATSIRESILAEQISLGDSVHNKKLTAKFHKQLSDDSAALAARLREIDSVKSLARPAYVALRTDTLLTLYVPTGSLSPSERAALYSERVLQAAKTFSAARDSLEVVDNGISADVVYGDFTLINVTDMDAYWEGVSRGDLATAKKVKLAAAFAAYEKNQSMWNIIRMIGLSLLVVAVMVALFKLVGHAFCKVIDRKIVDNRDKWFKGIRFRSIEILTSAKLLSAVLFASKALRYAIYAFLLYTALPMIFVIFPATRHLAGVLFSWIVTPLISMGEGFIAYLPKLLRIIVIVVVTRYVLKFLHYVAREIESGRLVIPRFYPDWAQATFNLLKIFLIAFTVVLIFPLLPESESSVFKGVSVFIGVLFSIGSSSVISNMVAGMVITYMRSFRVGDRIRVGDVFGDVVEKTLFVVRVQTVKKEVITVPNSTILSSNVINYSIAAGDEGVILHQTVDVGYDVTWDRASKLLIEAALRTEHVLPSPTPFVLTQTLGSCAATHQINVFTKRPDLQAKIYSDMNRHILELFQRDGIEMVNPVYEAARSGEKSTIPEEYKTNQSQSQDQKNLNNME
jgi:small-conductance mechanosensitive channel